MKIKKVPMWKLLSSLVFVAGSVLIARYFFVEKKQNSENFSSKQEERVKTKEYAGEVVKNNISLDKNLHIISEKCIGCGKCVRISPENFSLDRDSRKAEVVSQEEQGENFVQQAIDRCPVGAIVKI